MDLALTDSGWLFDFYGQALIAMARVNAVEYRIHWRQHVVRTDQVRKNSTDLDHVDWGVPTEKVEEDFEESYCGITALLRHIRQESDQCLIP